MARIGKAGRVVLIVLSVPLGIIVIVLGVLLVLSPGRPKPFVDEHGKVLSGSVSEKIRVSVNGVEQGMFNKSRDTANPVLLFLHGGAGMPEYFLAQRYPTGLEEYFTVCWWDRRGAGLSYGAGSPQTMTVEQLVSDTLEVTNYLRGRFHKEKVFLMAHSGGSIIGIQAAARAPGLYHAYIGAAQMAYQLESERTAYEYMLKRYREIGDAGMVRRLEAAPPTMSSPLPASYMAIRDPAMHGIGVGTMRDMRSVITGVFLQSWLCPDYTVSEKLGIWRGKFLCDRILLPKLMATDLARQLTRLELPVYFFHGRHDYTVSYPVTRAYYEKLSAPLKGFYTFEESAHSPMFEEPARMRQIFQEDILAGANRLADGA